MRDLIAQIAATDMSQAQGLTQRKQFLTQLDQSLRLLNLMYSEQLKKKLEEFTDVTARDELKFCSYFPEEGIHSCNLDTASLQKANNSFVVVLHNTGMTNQSFARIKLPTADYRLWVWNRTWSYWAETDVDIHEQVHYVPKPNSKPGSDKISDFEMFVPIFQNVTPGEIAFVRVEKNGNSGKSYTSNSNTNYKSSWTRPWRSAISRTSLKVNGITDTGDIQFLYTNTD